MLAALQQTLKRNDLTGQADTRGNTQTIFAAHRVEGAAAINASHPPIHSPSQLLNFPTSHLLSLLTCHIFPSSHLPSSQPPPPSLQSPSFSASQLPPTQPSHLPSSQPPSFSPSQLLSFPTSQLLSFPPSYPPPRRLRSQISLQFFKNIRMFAQSGSGNAPIA